MVLNVIILCLLTWQMVTDRNILELIVLRVFLILIFLPGLFIIANLRRRILVTTLLMILYLIQFTVACVQPFFFDYHVENITLEALIYIVIAIHFTCLVSW